MWPATGSRAAIGAADSSPPWRPRGRAARPGDDPGGLALLRPRAQRPFPGADTAVEDGDVLVPEVPQQPPEPRGAAGHALVVGHDEDPGADAGPRRRPREPAPRGPRGGGRPGR